MALVARGAWRCVVAFQLAAANRAAANAAPIEAPRQSDAGSQRRTRPFFLCCRTFKRVQYRLLKVDRDDPKVPGEEEQEVEDDFAEIVAATPLQFRQANKLWDEILPLQTIHNIAPVIKLWIERDEHIGIPGILFVIAKLRSFRRSRQALSVRAFFSVLHVERDRWADSRLAGRRETVWRIRREPPQAPHIDGVRLESRTEGRGSVPPRSKRAPAERIAARRHGLRLRFDAPGRERREDLLPAKIPDHGALHCARQAILPRRRSRQGCELLPEHQSGKDRAEPGNLRSTDERKDQHGTCGGIGGRRDRRSQARRSLRGELGDQGLGCKQRNGGVWLPTVCYLNAVDALGAAGKVAAAEKVADEMESTKNKYVELSAAMIRVYARNEMADKAEAVIEDLRDNGVWAMFRPYAELITAYLDRDQPVKAMDALKKALLVKRMVPTYAVILKMLPVFERLRDAEGAEDMVGRYKGVTDLRMYKGLLRVYLSARVKPLEEIEARLMVKKLELDDETRGLLKALRNIVG